MTFKDFGQLNLPIGRPRTDDHRSCHAVIVVWRVRERVMVILDGVADKGY